MKGKVVGEARASVSSPRQKSVATRIPKPRRPLRSTEASIDLGMIVDAFSISSATGVLAFRT